MIRFGQHSFHLKLVCLALLSFCLLFTSHPAEAKRKKSRKVWQTYRVYRGDTVKNIAKRLKVRVKDLRRWNRIKKKRSKLKPGKKLKFKAIRRRSESVGRPNRGSLVGGVHLDPDNDHMGLGWTVRASRNTIWGTPETIRYIKRCGREFRRYFPAGKGDAIPVGSISARDGGLLPPHKSHQSGRDVDIGLLRKKPPPPGIFLNTKPKELHLYKQWVITKCFLDNDQTKMVILERSLVNVLRKYIKRIYKKRPKKLKKYLAFFPGRKGAILLADNEHKSHMHVRFKCPKDDRRCIP